MNHQTRMSEQDYKPEGEGTNPTDDEVTTDESTETEEEVAEEAEKPSESDQLLELERLRKKNYELSQRLKKEKARSEKSRTDLDSPEVPVAENVIQKQVLKAQGEPEELLAVLQTISEEQGIDLLSAKNDDYYQYRKAKFEQEQKDKAAGLGASKGSGQGRKVKTFETPGLSRDEHKKLWDKAMKR